MVRITDDYKIAWLVIIGTIPIGILGFLFQDVIRDTFRNLWLVAIVLIVFGLILGAADALGRAVGQFELGMVSFQRFKFAE